MDGYIHRYIYTGKSAGKYLVLEKKYNFEVEVINHLKEWLSVSLHDIAKIYAG
jgi:hypothetical protein